MLASLHIPNSVTILIFGKQLFTCKEGHILGWGFGGLGPQVTKGMPKKRRKKKERGRKREEKKRERKVKKREKINQHDELGTIQAQAGAPPRDTGKKGRKLQGC